MRLKVWGLAAVGLGILYTALRQQWDAFMAGVLLVFAVAVAVASAQLIRAMDYEGSYLSDESLREVRRESFKAEAIEDSTDVAVPVRRPEKRERSKPGAFSQPWRGPDKA